MNEPQHFMPSPLTLDEMQAVPHDAQLGLSDAEWDALVKRELAAMPTVTKPTDAPWRYASGRTRERLMNAEFLGDCL